ncbi:hypothetical protein NCCP2495_24600 [Dietzia sp. NCCP-2495]|nr:hypothetical protein NCCP2495_24600 [Dietzia sp. NCCP-2495]
MSMAGRTMRLRVDMGPIRPDEVRFGKEARVVTLYEITPKSTGVKNGY